MKLSIVIPAYNEAHRLPQTLETYGSFFKQHLGEEFELIVVANHCSDATEEVVRKAMASSGSIRLIVEPRRIGKGGAVDRGMHAAQGEWVGFVDADGATSAESFLRLFENIEHHGCIIGSRWMPGAVVYPQQSWMRRIASRILNKAFVNGWFQLDVSDSQCGAKVFRKDVLEKILSKATEPGWAFDIDVLCRVKRLGYDIREFPVEWCHVPGNPTGFVIMGLQMLASIWRVKRALARS